MGRIRVRYLVRLSPPPGTGKDFLETVRSLARSMMAEARNPKWTSHGALELDIFTNSKQDFQLFIVGVEPLAKIEFTTDLNEAPRHRTKAELVSEARGYFNSERYWETHELLEVIWRNAEGEEKLFVQGLILVCASLVHHQKDEDRVALGVLRRATRQLTYGRASYHGIDVRNVARETRKILESRRFRAFSI